MAQHAVGSPEPTPAKSGDVLVIYCAGLGAVDPAVPAGSPAPLSTLTNTINRVSVTIRGTAVDPLFAGLTPGFTGLYQINVRVPAGSIDDDNTQLTISVAGQASTPVTLAIRNPQ